MGEAHVRKVGPIAAVANVVELWPRRNLPWDPEIGHQRAHIQVTDMGGGSAILYVRSPADTWEEYESGLGEGDVVVVIDPWPGFRVVFTSGGNVWASGHSKVWR